MKLKDLAKFIPFSGDYNSLANKPTIPEISSKQDTLVSGTNIKTVNNTSLLGSGNIVISGSGLSQAQVRRLNA